MSRRLSCPVAYSSSTIRRVITKSTIVAPTHLRCQSSAALPNSSDAKPSQWTGSTVKTTISPMRRLPIWNLLRSIATSYFLTTPILLKPGMALMTRVANSRSLFLNPDLNPLLKMIIKPLIYQQFCAGVNFKETQQVIQGIRDLGFAGVALTYAKEIHWNKGKDLVRAHGDHTAQLQAWLNGNLQTLDMIESGDWLAIKLTGAGMDVAEALLRGDEPPAQFMAALRTICEKAKAQNCRVWIDAEQQAVQPTIDKWTLSFMREFNKNGSVLVYTTIQAYLKSSRQTLKHQLETAHKEGWTCCVKLVRGAYISNEIRELIHNTKSDTDACYNGIVQGMLSGTFENLSPEHFTNARLLLAGHNSESVRRALELSRSLALESKLKVAPEFAQLQGMADDIGCEIAQWGEEQKKNSTSIAAEKAHALESYVPKVYKCSTWGSVQECMQYLVRRAVENAAAVDRMRETAAEARKELFRRMRLSS